MSSVFHYHHHSGCYFSIHIQESCIPHLFVIMWLLHYLSCKHVNFVSLLKQFCVSHRNQILMLSSRKHAQSQVTMESVIKSSSIGLYDIKKTGSPNWQLESLQHYMECIFNIVHTLYTITCWGCVCMQIFVFTVAIGRTHNNNNNI